ncbi:MAG: hypothetical protein KJO46_06770 [Gammaproteobacteria bacterium]|nr:hypothetical protein [Gammaproteobacteria bacterium]
MDTRRLLMPYYAATVLFLLLDYVAGINVRLAFLDDLPYARAGYYLVCFTCLGLMLWRPAWTELISAFESLVTLVALIIGMGVRTLLVTDRMLEGTANLVTIEQLINFLLAGAIAYIAWVRGINTLVRRNSR